MKRSNSLVIFALLSLGTNILNAEPLVGNPEKRIEKFFAEFDNSPKSKMNQIPQKFDSAGNPLPLNLNRFREEDITSGRYIDAKAKVRARFCTGKAGQDCAAPSPEGAFAGFDGDNMPRPFLDKSKLLNLNKMDELELFKGEVAEHPWSGDYWGTYRGGVGARYNDKNFPSSSDWKDYWNYFEANLKKLNIFELETKDLKFLSPGEKYDLLVGDTNKSLTNWTWRTSKDSENSKGEVETWFGLCHGWAPAAYRMARPLKSVGIELEGGKKLDFHPHDIKAIGTLLWANARVPTLFLGGRCDDKKPKQDDNGRILSAQCFDTNPGSFHASIVNRVGVEQKSFVMDATYDYEVWNHPIVSYRYTYYNPQTRKVYKTAEAAAIAMEEFTKDRFTKYRNTKATMIVGVMMDVEYTVETQATSSRTDGPAKDATNLVEYIYDLELDEKFNIVGGEWYSNAHPDFLWTPYETYEAASYSDSLLEASDWDGRGTPSVKVQEAARIESRRGFPLKLILDKIVEASQE